MCAETMIEERIFTIDQVARILGYHRNSIIRWVRSGELTASQPGGREYRIRESDLDEFMRRKQITRKDDQK